MDWSLSFRESSPVTVEICERALSEFAGGPVTTVRAPYQGNPRDGFYRDVTITAPCPTRGVTLALQVCQESWFADDPDASTTKLGTLYLNAPAAPFTTKLAAWYALRDAVAAIGWVDRTLVSWPKWIIDDAVASGETEIEARLRVEITAARIEDAKRPDHYEVGLASCCADDLEPVLEAYVDPARIVFMTLSDCGLRTLPKAFVRFPNLEIVTLDHNKLDAGVLRVSLPKLYMLGLTNCGLETLDRDDLAGFPELKRISIANNPLRAFDPRILDVCPKLGSVHIEHTPLARDDASVAALRERGLKVTF